MNSKELIQKIKTEKWEILRFGKVEGRYLLTFPRDGEPKLFMTPARRRRSK